MNCTGCKLLEARMEAIEKSQKNVQELVDLLEEVKGALRLFIKAGRFIKWLAGILLAFSGIAWAIRHFGSAP